MKKLVLLSTAAAALFMAGCAPKAPEVDMNADANKVEQPATTPATISDAERLNLLQSQVQNVYFDFDKFNIRPDMQNAINENASIAEVVDFDCTNINNTILTKHDNNNEVYHDNNDNLNLLDNFIKDTKIEPNVNILNEIETKNEILNDIFVNEGLNPNFSIMETNRPYTPPLSKMVPLQDENNNNINVNNISKINESIIHNHYPEMVYDTKRGKYYNSKTNVYYDFK